MDVLFAIQSYKDDSLPASAQEAINCYAELEPPDAKTSAALQGFQVENGQKLELRTPRRG